MLVTMKPIQDDPTRKLMGQVVGVTAEYEKSMIEIKLRGGLGRKRTRTRRCEGRKLYCHYPGEKSVIQRMKELQKEGLGSGRFGGPSQRKAARERARLRPGAALQ